MSYWRLLISAVIGYIGASLVFKEEGCERGITTLNGLIMDTGSPEGGPAPDRAPTRVPFLNMNKLYQNNNVVYSRNGVYIYPARNNTPIGPPKVLPACPGPEITYHAGYGFFDKEYPQNGCGNARADAVNHPGQDGIGLCGCGFRNILVEINGHQLLAMIDSGLNSAILSPNNARKLGLIGKEGHLEAKVLPSQSLVGSHWHIQDDMGDEKITFPVYSMVESTNVILTRDYTIIESLTGGKMTYDCRMNKVDSVGWATKKKPDVYEIYSPKTGIRKKIDPRLGKQMAGALNDPMNNCYCDRDQLWNGAGCPLIGQPCTRWNTPGSRLPHKIAPMRDPNSKEMEPWHRLSVA